ncbi:cytochrome c family protein [Leptospira interrogans]|uniref:cytochrome c family protein n=1 Tax=Leptospira interrogans TaxID=173 RepID=UPI001E4FAAF6|nr:cytochrome c family protein [Leptospira interrogans]
MYNDLINISEKDKVLNGSKTCQSCHKNIFENWQKSMHSQSFTNPFYQESHAKELT